MRRRSEEGPLSVARGVPRHAHNNGGILPLRVLDSGLRGGLGCAPMRTQSTIAGIPVYVISLADAQVRRANMTARLGAIGLPFQFVDAIDGRTQRLPDVFDGAQVDRQGFQQSEAEIGCAMSHRLVQRMIVEGDGNLALILEDDADPQPDFLEALALGTRLRFDVLKLQGGIWGRRAKVGQVGKYRVTAGTGSIGATAYLITRRAAQRCCALPVIDQASDLIFSDLRLGLRVLDLEPYPVTQDGTPSEIGARAFKKVKPRLGRFAQLMLSIRKRSMFVRLYGLRAAIAMDAARFIENRQ
jgi:hypothetical protein